jgi:hypothetical protein
LSAAEEDSQAMYSRPAARACASVATSSSGSSMPARLACPLAHSRAYYQAAWNLDARCTVASMPGKLFVSPAANRAHSSARALAAAPPLAVLAPRVFVAASHEAPLSFNSQSNGSVSTARRQHEAPRGVLRRDAMTPTPAPDIGSAPAGTWPATKSLLGAR